MFFKDFKELLKEGGDNYWGDSIILDFLKEYLNINIKGHFMRMIQQMNITITGCLMYFKERIRLYYSTKMRFIFN